MARGGEEEGWLRWGCATGAYGRLRATHGSNRVWGWRAMGGGGGEARTLFFLLLAAVWAVGRRRRRQVGKTWFTVWGLC